MASNLNKMPAEMQELTSEYDSNVTELTNKDNWKDKMLVGKDSATPKSSSSENVKLILENDSLLKNVVKYNEFSEMLEKSKSVKNINLTLKVDNISGENQWTDNDTAKLRTYIEVVYNYVPTPDAVYTGLISYATNHSYNPVKKYIESEKWDGTPRVGNYFVDYLGAENSDYTKEVTKKWFEGAIARVYKPGIKFDMVPVISGKQGLGKSTLIAKIFPTYVDDSLKNLGKTKDDYQKLTGAWIFELGELSAMSKTDIELTKGFISATKDRYRSSYGRITEVHQRKCVFIGTSNDLQYLKDETGNRRFYPIECKKDNQTKSPFNIGSHLIHQILAEAKAKFEKGGANSNELLVSPEIEKTANLKRGNAMQEDPVKEQVLRYLDMNVPVEWKGYSQLDKRHTFENYCRALDQHIDPALILPNKDNSNSVDNFKVVHEPFEKLSVTTTKEILYVVLDISDHDLVRVARGNEAKKIGLYIRGTDEWEFKHSRAGNIWQRMIL